MRESKNLRSFNLNTLPILREILLQGSVSKAAIKLNVSQPALSATLKQLRIQFDDELLIRSGGSIGLTPKAKALLAPLEQTLSAVQDFITPPAEDPRQPPTVIRIASTDHVMSLLGAPLAQLLLEDNVRVLPHFLNAGGHSPLQLLNGDIDFIILPKQVLTGSLVSARDHASLNSEPLFSEHLVGIGRGIDKDLERGLSVEAYLARPHVSFAIDSERNISAEMAFLATNNLKQNDIARFSCYNALLGVVASTQSIALVPANLAHAVQDTFGLTIFTPPIAFPPLEWTMIWHNRNDDNDKFSQFRTILKSCAEYALRD
jgi:DNA-binding transcriptional LysR family regulator